MPLIETLCRKYIESIGNKVITKEYFDKVFSDYQVSSARNHLNYSLKTLPQEIRDIYELVKDRTMTPVERLFNFCDSADYCARTGIEGAIVECGTWRGGGMAAIARYIMLKGHAPRDLYLYDTFEGHPKPDAERDIDVHGNDSAAIWEKHKVGVSEDKSNWGVADLDDVKAGMAETGYPSDKIHFVKGRVEHTLPQIAHDKIAVLRLDTDWYQSTKHILNTLYDRVPSGGIIIFDDYGHVAGAKMAVDEFFEERSLSPLLFRIDYSCRATVKI